MIECYLYRADWAPMPEEIKAAVESHIRTTGFEPNKVEHVFVAKARLHADHELARLLSRIDDTVESEIFRPDTLQAIIGITVRY